MTALLPEPMLCKPGPLPVGDGWWFEVKWDGFRGLACTRQKLRVRSRRGMDLTGRAAELSSLPSGYLYDGELVCLGADGKPDFRACQQRFLGGHDAGIFRYVIFDLLASPSGPLLDLPYLERRLRLEQIDLPDCALVSERFTDGQALHAATLEHGLEGIVCKRAAGKYRPSERGWLKVKHRSYARYPEMLAAAQSRRRRARG